MGQIQRLHGAGEIQDAIPHRWKARCGAWICGALGRDAIEPALVDGSLVQMRVDLPAGVPDQTHLEIRHLLGCGKFERGKTNNQKALVCEGVLMEFRERHRTWLQQAPSEKATAILTKLDSQAARILLNKRCKFASYEALTAALAAEMGASGVSPGPQSSPQDTAGGGVLVSVVGKAATALDQLRDAGVLPGSWVQCTKDSEGCKAGDVGQVLHLTEQEMEWQPRSGKQAASGSS